ncbi:MAG: zinc ribbon domain-containing protein [Nanoarchaeota archaeon]|jgi:hypothetical protein|nr:zinc ribbon domain-containing protein [Nanoarchaeota archaeon]
MTICQSCGINIIDEEDFGTESNGSLSEMYCLYCYKNGEFKFKGSFNDFVEKQIDIAIRIIGLSPSEAEDTTKAKLLKLFRWQDESLEDDDDSDFFEEED